MSATSTPVTEALSALYRTESAKEQVRDGLRRVLMNLRGHGTGLRLGHNHFFFPEKHLLLGLIYQAGYSRKNENDWWCYVRVELLHRWSERPWNHKILRCTDDETTGLLHESDAPTKGVFVLANGVPTTRIEPLEDPKVVFEWHQYGDPNKKEALRFPEIDGTWLVLLQQLLKNINTR